MTEVGELIGKGRIADVHAYGARAIKLYQPGRSKTHAFAEASTLGLLEAHRLPTPRVYEVGSHGGRWGLVMDRVAGVPLGQLATTEPARVADCLDEMVRLQLLIHAVVEPRLPSLKARLLRRIAGAPELDKMLGARVLTRTQALPDGDRVCHGDFHPFNIIGLPGSAVVIDWLDATVGAPAADVCRSYLLLTLAAPEVAGQYLERYVRRSDVSSADVLAWLPTLAAARLAEGVDGEAGRLLAMAGEA